MFISFFSLYWPARTICEAAEFSLGLMDGKLILGMGRNNGPGVRKHLEGELEARRWDAR